MAADVTQRPTDGELINVAVGLVEIPLHHTDLERARRQGDADVGLQTGQRIVFRHLQVEGVQQRTEEQENLHAGQHVAQTHSPAESEWHEVLRFVNFTLGGEETLRSEGFRLVPQFRIHVNGVQQGYQLRTGWYEVTVHNHISVTR